MTPIIWLIIFLVILLIAGFFVWRSKERDVTTGPKVGTKESLGWGIIGLGVLGMLMPWAAGALASPKNDPFSILTGASYTLGFFVILAGLALLLTKETTEG